MGTGLPLVTRYRLRWLLMLAVFIMVVLWVFAYCVQRYIPPNMVRSEVVEKNQPPQTFERLTGPLKVTAENLVLTLSSSDGSLHVRFWAEQAGKDGSNLFIENGAVEFIMENREALELLVSNAGCQLESGSATISGTIRGRIASSGQYFEATELSWDQAAKMVYAKSVTYIANNFEVHGQSMQLNLITGEVSFSEGVEVGV
jgi:hypothetical protein